MKQPISLFILLSSLLATATPSFADTSSLNEASIAVRMKNFVHAAELLKPLAESGDKKAQYRLGSLYRNGQGVLQNDKTAFKWVKKSAQQDHVKAQYQLGILYSDGRGIKTDLRQARHWFEKAASQGNRLAKNKLIKLKNSNISIAGDDIQKQLRYAIKKNNIVRFSQLLNSVSDINWQDENGTSLLMAAVQKGQTNITTLLLKNQANPNIKDNFGDTALHLATRKKAAPTVTTLLQYNADVNLTDAHGNTALVLATQNNESDLVEIFIKQQANITIKNSKGWDALRYARNNKQKKIIYALKLAGAINTVANTAPLKTNKSQSAHITATTKGLAAASQSGLYAGTPPLIQASWRGQIALVKELLNKKKSDLNAVDKNNLTALQHAAEEGGTEIVQLLITAGADINKHHKQTYSALMLAINHQHSASTEALLKATEIELDYRSDDGMTALLLAIKQEQTATIKQLLSAGANPNITTLYGETSLHLAVTNKQNDVIKTLLQHDVTINLKDNDGRSSLWLAAKMGIPETVTLLLQYRAMSQLSDHDNNTALLIAAKGGHERVVKILLDNNAKGVNHKNDNGNTALMLAAIKNPATCQQLINAGATLDNKNTLGDTALIIAVRHGDEKIVQVLLDAGADTVLRNNRREWAKGLAETNQRPDLVEIIDKQQGGKKRFFGVF